MSDISVWRSNLGDNGLAKSNRFRVMVTLPEVLSLKYSTDDARQFSFMASEVSWLGKSLLTTGFRAYGPDRQVPHHVKFNDLEISFYTNAEMEEYIMFDYWMNRINGRTTGYDIAFPNTFQTEITIEKLNELGEISSMMQVTKAYPINVSSIPLAWIEDGVVKVTAQFAYGDYYIVE